MGLTHVPITANKDEKHGKTGLQTAPVERL